MVVCVAPVEKFRDYIFKPGPTHRKDHVFRSLGYDQSHSDDLASLFEQQAAEKYARGSTTMLENYLRVRLKTNKYRLEGASEGDLGYIIEVYPDGGYEVEFSDKNGTTFAQVVARENELQPDEPSLVADGLAMSGAVMETVYHTPPSVQQQSKLTRSNKK